MLSKLIKKTLNCLATSVIVLSLGCTAASAKTSNINQTFLVPAKNINNFEDYSSFKITNGYGAVAKTDNISLTKGATTNIDVNVKVKCITQDDLVNFIENNKSLFTAEQYNQITQNWVYKNGYSTATLLNGLLGLKFETNATNAWSAYNNVNAKQVTTTKNEDKQLLKLLHDMTQENYHLIGELKAVGKSYIPISNIYCFVQVSKVQFEDGNVLKVVNTKATIADATCSTSKVGDSLDNHPLSLVDD